MKYSFIIPFFNRPSFLFTLNSFLKYYGDRDDFEIVVVEDKKNAGPRHDNLLENIDKFPSFKFKHILANFNTTNPAQAYNLGADCASGEFLIITNPECYHTVDILSSFDKCFEKTRDYYCVCSCQSVVLKKILNEEEFDIDKRVWYQHSVFNNRCLHFCTSMSKDNYKFIGGFDEQYGRGHSFDDNDFYEKIIWYKLPIKTLDESTVYHIEHDREYGIKLKDRLALEKINEDYYNEKWKTIKDTKMSPTDFEYCYAKRNIEKKLI